MINSQMRVNVLKLIDSNETTYRIAKSTGIPESTVNRIWRGETSLDNVKFATMEKLERYYLDLAEGE